MSVTERPFRSSDRAAASPANPPPRITTRGCRPFICMRCPLAWFSLEPGATLHDAAVHEDRRARDVARAVAGDEGDDARDLGRSREASHGNGLFEALQLGGIGLGRRVDGCRDGAGTDADYRDAVRRV